MKTKSRALVLSLLALPTLYLAVSRDEEVHASRSSLPRSPLSAGVLLAQSIQSGRLQLPGHQVRPEALTCSPAPCALPNLQASVGGTPAP
jgi:hypothetical protein